MRKRRQLAEEVCYISLCAQSIAKVALGVHVLLHTTKSACICHVSEKNSTGICVFLAIAASKAHETEL